MGTPEQAIELDHLFTEGLAGATRNDGTSRAWWVLHFYIDFGHSPGRPREGDVDQVNECGR